MSDGCLLSVAAPDERPPPAIEAAVAALAGTPLPALAGVAVLDRVDTKFLVPLELVADLLDRCSAHYLTLDVGGRRAFRYRTRYFDTAGLAFYHAHHAGRLPREKVRIREYLDSGTRFLELKRKLNTGRTQKLRTQLDGADGDGLALLAGPAFAAAPSTAAPADLHEVTTARYLRHSLVRCDHAERVTVDTAITLTMGSATATFAGMAIVEIKQPRHDRSPFLDALKSAGRRRGGISKYCMGIVALHPTARKNRFKRVLAHLHRV